MFSLFVVVGDEFGILDFTFLSRLQY